MPTVRLSFIVEFVLVVLMEMNTVLNREFRLILLLRIDSLISIEFACDKLILSYIIPPEIEEVEFDTARAQVDQGSQIKMIQVKEMMQDNDLKNSKSKDKGSKSRSQSMDEQSHYKLRQGPLQAKHKRQNVNSSCQSVVQRSLKKETSTLGEIVSLNYIKSEQECYRS
ncbi:hypothetical protein Tco_0008363 [Tanacetum coccineum]